jgi:flagellar biosynthetic protein FliQ
MDPQTVIELGRNALWTMLIVGAPVLLAGLVVGLAVGLFQALTQIQDHSLTLAPKLVVMFLVLGATLPWIVARMSHYTSELIAGIPGRF